MASVSFNDLIPQDNSSALMRDLYPDEFETDGVSFDDLIPEEPIKQAIPKDVAFDDLIPKEETPQSTADFWHKLSAPEEGYEYGEILPLKKDIKTGEKSLAVPTMIRSVGTGIGDLFKMSEEKSVEVTPDALNAMMTLLPIGGGAKAVTKKAATTAPELPVEVPPIPTPIGDLSPAHQEALAQVAIGARNPFTLTPEQTANRLADANLGSPIVNPELTDVYHATTTGGLVFEKGKGELGTHLATTPEQANIVSRSIKKVEAVGAQPNILPLKASIKNPIELLDQPDWTKPDDSMYGLLTRVTHYKDPTGIPDGTTTWQLSSLGEKAGLKPDDAKELRTLYFDAFIKPDEYQKRFTDYLNSKGFDAIKYTNRYEDNGTDSFIVWNPEKLRSSISDTQTVKDIDAQIKQIAANTAAPGAKEKLAELQQQKAELTNPQAAIDKRIKSLAGKITDEQFDTNIKYPVQNAIDSGAPISRVRAELEANLQTSIKDPAYRKELVERAIPEAYKEAEQVANAAALVTNTNPNVVDGIIGNSVKYTDDGSLMPSVAPKNAKQLGKVAVDTILNNKYAKGRSVWVDDMTLLDLIDRASFKANNRDIGRRDIAEKGDLTVPKNLSQRGAEMVHSLVGNAAGTNNFILRSAPNKSILEKDTSILPLNTSMRLAKNGGMSNEDISEFLRARDAYDDYANIERTTTEVKQKLKDNEVLIKTLREKDTSKLDKRQKRALFNQIETIKQDMIESARFLKETAAKESHMPREEVNAILAKYSNNAVAQTFGENINKLHSHMLDMLVDSGKLSAESAASIRKAHPNYLPAWRDVEDFTFSGTRYRLSGDSPKPFRKREISKKELGDVYENMVLNIVSTTRKAEQAKFRGMVLQDFLLPKLDKEGFKAIFREDKDAVLKAVDDLKAGKRQRISAEEITPTDADKVQNVGNIVFDINGRQLQLTVVDYEMFKELSKVRLHEEISPYARMLIAASRLRRNLITAWNPSFSIRAFQRDAMDFVVGAKAKPFKDYIPVISNFKYLFTKEFDPELYSKIADNLGFGSTVARDFYGKSAEEVAKISKEALNKTPKTGVVEGVTRRLENFANRVDIGPRVLQYKIAMKNLLKEGVPEAEAQEQAMRLARELGVNYAQKGSGPNGIQLDTYIKTVTFARTFINSTDRLIRYARYEPVKLARNTFLGLYLPYAAVMQYNKQFTDENGVPYVDKLDPNIKKDVIPIYGAWSENENDYIPWRLGWVFGRSVPAIDKSVSYAQQQIGQLMDKGMEEESQRIVDADNETAKSVKATGITGKEVYSAWLDYTFGLIQPTSMLPVGLSDAAALVNNTDAFGRAIVPPDLGDKPAFAQTRPGETSQALTDFAYYLQQKTGVSFSPIQAEYLVNSLFASAGAISMTAGNYIYAAGTGRELPEIENKDIPLFNTFSGKGSAVGREGASSKFYNINRYLQDIGDTYEALKDSVEANPANAPDLLEFEQENAVELHYLDKYKESLAAIKDYRDGISQIVSADKKTLIGSQTPETELLGDPVKRKKVDELRRKIIDVQKAMLKDIEDSNLNTDDIWSQRLTHTPATKLLQAPFNLFPNKEEKPTEKKTIFDTEETEERSFLDNFSLVSSAQAAPRKLKIDKLLKELGITKPEKVKQATDNVNTFVRVAREEGADPKYFIRLAAQESALGLNAGKEGKGLFQIMPGTYALLKKKYPEAAKLDRTNPEHNARLAIMLAKSDAEDFKRNKGRWPHQDESVILHFLGLENTLKMLELAEKNVKKPSTKFLKEGVTERNKKIFYTDDGKIRTPREAINELVRLYSRWDSHIK